jgi:RNA polymerase sigma-70 factor (ECF subfamily)
MTIETEPIDAKMRKSQPSPLADDPDEALWIDRFKANDPGSIDHLHPRYSGRLYGVLRVMGSSHEDAQDLVQDAFWTAWERRDLFDRGRPFWPWLVDLAVKKAIDNHRRRERRAKHEGKFPREVGVHANPGEGLDRVDLARVLQEAMESLDEVDRRILWLHKVEDRTYPQIGEVMGLSVQQVQRRLTRARTQMEAALQTMYESLKGQDS